MRVLVLLLLLAVVIWLFREFADAHRSRGASSERLGSATRALPSTRRQLGRPPSQSHPPVHQRVSDDDLRERVAALRAAIARGDVTRAEAEDSLVRWAGMRRRRAEQLLG